MKKIDKLILSNFAGPYVVSFFIAEFVLIMQFLWKYIDDILGKGFTILEIMRMISYYGVMIIPMALPISILIASVMVFGDIAEKYELTSMKSAGISLIRVMMPGILLAFCTFIFSIIASNYLKPTASLEFNSWFKAMRRQKSSLSIEEGIFNDDFRNYRIRVASKDKEGIDVNDVLIYDHSKPDRSLLNIINAEKGQMFTSKDGKYFIMNLENGNFYKEDSPETNENGTKSFPLIRTSFKTWKKVFDMDEFAFEQNSFDISRNKQDMLNTFQLIEHLDTLKSERRGFRDRLVHDYNGILTSTMDESKLEKAIEEERRKKIEKDSLEVALKDSLSKVIPLAAGSESMQEASKDFQIALEEARKKNQPIAQREYGVQNNSGSQSLLLKLDSVDHFYETFDSVALKGIMYRARSFIVSRTDLAVSIGHNIEENNSERNAYLLRLQQQYSFAFVCIIFMFIGAPLGSIIRKGGYGYPLLVAILFYMVFIISTIMGEKLVRSGSVNGVVGAWIPCLILLPFTFFFTYKALNDSKFDGLKKIETWFTNRMEKKAQRRIARRTV